MGNKSLKKFVGSSEFYLLMVDLVLVLFLTIYTGGTFLKLSNLRSLVVGYSALGIIAAGVLVVIISGGIDISFMAIATIAQYAMAQYMLHAGGNFVIIIVISVAIGIALGCINALLVYHIKAPTLIVTLATMSIFNGILLWATKGVKLFGFPDWFAVKTPASIVAIPIGFLVFVFLLTWYILRFTKMGRKIYAIGGNIEAARRMGVNILRVQLFVYAYVGAIAALGAIVQCYLIQQVALNDLVGNEMDVIAMVVLGGVALSGGKGTVSGTVLGMLLVAIMSNGLTLIGVSSYYQDLVIGAVILVSFCLTGWQMLQNVKKANMGGKLDDGQG